MSCENKFASNDIRILTLSIFQNSEQRALLWNNASAIQFLLQEHLKCCKKHLKMIIYNNNDYLSGRKYLKMIRESILDELHSGRTPLQLINGSIRSKNKVLSERLFTMRDIIKQVSISFDSVTIQRGKSWVVHHCNLPSQKAMSIHLFRIIIK